MVAVQPKRGDSSKRCAATVPGPLVNGPGYPAAIPVLGDGAALMSPVRVAVIAPIAWRTPPRHYGPWELFASLLTEGLVARRARRDIVRHGRLGDDGHAASSSARGLVGGSSTSTPKVAECLHIAAVFERADEFDIIHNGFDFLPLTYSGLVDTPVVTTIHGFSSPRIVPVYERYNATTTYVAISDADRHPRLDYAATIHHGIDTDAFAVDPAPGELPVVLRPHPPRQGHGDAIEVARAVGSTARHRGIVQDQAYFDDARSHPTSTATACATSARSAPSDRSDVLGAAHALLHLIDFDEPFGYSVVEAMACGTPVIAYDRGSMRELVDDGLTGYLVADVDGAVDALEPAGLLDRQMIRAIARTRFDRAVMVDQYVAVYRSVLGSSG